MCLLLSRLVMYMERDLRKATPLREHPSQSAYLSQCLDLLIVNLSNIAPGILGTYTLQPSAFICIPPIVLAAMVKKKKKKKQYLK